MIMTFLKKYFYIFAFGIVAILSSCSAGNKEIPDLFDITKIDSTNDILSIFNVYGVGDTSFTMTVSSLDSLAPGFVNSVKDDSIKIVGIQTTGTSLTGNGIYITTYSTAPGVYSPDTTTGLPATAGVLIAKLTTGNFYVMNKGYVRISEVNTTEKTIRGDLDVNNSGNVSGKKFRVKAYFYVKYI